MWELYQKERSYSKVGKLMGCDGKTVKRRLCAAGYIVSWCGRGVGNLNAPLCSWGNITGICWMLSAVSGWWSFRGEKMGNFNALLSSKNISGAWQKCCAPKFFCYPTEIWALFAKEVSVHLYKVGMWRLSTYTLHQQRRVQIDNTLYMEIVTLGITTTTIRIKNDYIQQV